MCEPVTTAGADGEVPGSAERAALAADLEARLEAHPLAEVLTSMPGVGFRTAIKILTIVGDGAAFPTSGHLAAYAALAPVTRGSGSSIRARPAPNAATTPPSRRCSCRHSPV